MHRIKEMSIYHGESRVFYIDSSNRTSGTDSNFQINVNLPKNNFNRVALLQLSCPKSFYNFSTDKNTFTLRELGMDVTITIPIGNYNRELLLSTLSSLLTQASATAGRNWVYKVTYGSSPNTGLLTFTVTGNTGQPSLIFTKYCFIQLGFFGNSTNTFASSSLISVSCSSLSPVNRIYVKSNMCSTSDQSILQEVLQTYPDNSFIYYENINVDINSKPFVGNTNTTFGFIITDRFGEPIDTHGVNIMMSVLLYEKNNTDEIHKQELQIKSLERLYNTDQQVQKISSDVSNSTSTVPTGDSTTTSNDHLDNVSIPTARNVGSYYLVSNEETTPAAEQITKK